MSARQSPATTEKAPLSRVPQEPRIRHRRPCRRRLRRVHPHRRQRHTRVPPLHGLQLPPQLPLERVRPLLRRRRQHPRLRLPQGYQRALEWRLPGWRLLSAPLRLPRRACHHICGCRGHRRHHRSLPPCTRDAPDSIFGCNGGALIGVDLEAFELSDILLSQFLDDRVDHSARPTPWCPEFNQNSRGDKPIQQQSGCMKFDEDH
ncbi:homeobox protein knotted-1-like 4 [Striga asiatica]|uniref:Homeobox protein knotted-1-like 4 n=1 Tax=Striga asiatica TaxID=4170 RepID=A0A5A7RH96_STRAF|nr:homeobox protein knotted-1-like 4 [Striga asiatica]